MSRKHGVRIVSVCACCLVQAVFVAASYPSIPRIELALAAWREQQKHQQQQQHAPQAAHGTQQATHGSTQAAPTRPGSASMSAPGRGSSTPETQEGQDMEQCLILHGKQV